MSYYRDIPFSFKTDNICILALPDRCRILSSAVNESELLKRYFAQINIRLIVCEYRHRNEVSIRLSLLKMCV